MTLCKSLVRVALLVLILYCARLSFAEIDGAIVATGPVDVRSLSESMHGVSLDQTDSELKRGRPFVATEEWQTVEEDHELPPGLHVSIDMQSGEKKAKLMDQDEKPGISLESEQDPVKVRVISDSLKQINDEGSGEATSAEKLQKFAEKIAKDRLEGLKIRQDIEIMTGIMSSLIDSFKDSNITNDQLADLLEELEGFIHQIDNAVDFQQMGGNLVLLDFIANPNVSSSVRSAAAKVVASSSQNNPKVQQGVIRDGLLEKLLTQAILSTEELETKRTVFAISAIVRQNPEIQEEFIASGGYATLKALMLRDKWFTVRAAISRFIGDVSQERPCDKYGSNEKTENHRSITGNPDLRKYLKDNGWCAVLEKLFFDAQNYEKYYAKQDAVDVLEVLAAECPWDAKKYNP